MRETKEKREMSVEKGGRELYDGDDGESSCLPLAIIIGVLAPREVVIARSGLCGSGRCSNSAWSYGNGGSWHSSRCWGNANLAECAKNLSKARLNKELVGDNWACTYLSNVNVAALGVDLWIVRIKDRGVDAKMGRDGIAGVVWNDNIRVLAVLTNSSQADHLKGTSQL